MTIENRWTIGIEEEYQILDADTRELRPEGRAIVNRSHRSLGDEVQHELMLSQVEVASPVCATLADVRKAVTRSRRALIAAAESRGCRIAAAGTHPHSDWRDQPVTPKRRYRKMSDEYQQLAREQIIFGCHVHVGIRDRETAIHVMNRARTWLTPLLALAANSPFWLGDDTGYSSFRSELWSRWPMAGPPLPFASLEEHDRLVQTLVATGDLDDATRIYWDIRIPVHVETLEFRVTDVCLSVDEAVMIAGLVRALACTCHEQVDREEPFQPPRHELVRMAHWHAARYGLDAGLIDVQAGRNVPASEFIASFLEFLRDALEACGDWSEVSELVHETLERGNGAQRQREAFRRNGRWEDVVDLTIAETARGVSPPSLL